MTTKEQIAMEALMRIANRDGHIYYVGLPDGYSHHSCDFTAENAISIAVDAIHRIEEAGQWGR